MTGYARTQGQDTTLTWTWEVKSVNGRGLELRSRMAAGYDFLDLAAREAVQKRFKRGSITMSLTVARGREGAVLTVNEVVLARYMDLARQWQERMPGLTPPRLDGLFALRGVVECGDGDEDATQVEARGAAMLGTLRQALDALAAMRAAEGRRLAEVLAGHLAEIEGLVGRAEGLAALDPEAIKQRLRQQLLALLDAVPVLPEERLAQEAALIAAKADVREELDRLKAHVSAARDMLALGDAVGRRLDFLCQEFNREANTLCSKANDVELTRVGLSLKAVIEQLREQVQNIE